jgi:hypothetical protein
MLKKLRGAAMGRMTSKMAIVQRQSNTLTIQNQPINPFPRVEPIAMGMGMGLGPR